MNCRNKVDATFLVTFDLSFQYFKGAVQRIREAQAGLDFPIQVGIGIDITGTGIRLGSLAKVLVIVLHDFMTLLE